MKIRQIHSVDELRGLAPAWDDLWLRSELALPTLRAELLAQWLEHFADGQRFVATLVENDSQLVAALPLVETIKAGFLRLGQLPSNAWSASGDLLVDPNYADSELFRVIVDGIQRLPWPAIMLDQVDTSSPRWRSFAEACGNAGMLSANDPQFHVGVIDIDHDWAAYQKSWSSNHRHAVRKTKRKIDQSGDTRLIQYTELDEESLTRLLRTAFEIEDRSWKGEAGTSVLRTPRMADFFLDQARWLAGWGQLELIFLEHAGEPIAFEYCYVAKGVCFSHKIGYDPRFHQFGPGRLLRLLQLENYFGDDQRRLFDTLGILCQSKAKWCTRSYELGRLTLGTGGWAGRAFMQAYTRVWPHVRKIRGTDQPLPPPKLGAAPKTNASASKHVELVESAG